jgi:hypothetical protein
VRAEKTGGARAWAGQVRGERLWVRLDVDKVPGALRVRDG